MDNLNNIPQELRDRAQWLCWKYEQSASAIKPAKVPYHPNNYQIDPTDKNKLSTFAVAANAFGAGKFDGIGYSFQSDDPYCGIDLDKTDDLELVKVQNRIFEKFESYTEYSPSGEGVHIIVKGEVESGGINAGSIELYSDKRYFTFTGDVCRDLPITHGNGALTILWDELKANQQANRAPVIELPKFESTLTDEQVCAAAEQMTNGKFGNLWENKASNSEMDLSFCVMLRNAGADPVQAKRLFLAAPISSTVHARKKGHVDDYIDNRTLKRAFNDWVADIDATAFVASGQIILDARRVRRLEIEQKRLERARETRREQAESLRIEVEKRLSEKDHHEINWNDSPYSFGKPIVKGSVLPTPPGAMALLYQYLMDQSPYPVDGICMGAALCFVATVSGRAHNVFGEGLNTYILSLATTSAGKEGGTSGISKLVNILNVQFRNVESMFKPRQPNSAGGIVTDLAADTNPMRSILYSIDEFWSHFSKISNKRASAHDEQLKSAYLEFYTKSGQGKRAGGSSYSDRGKNVAVIESPNLNLFCFSVPEKFYSALDEDSFTDGFAPRFIIFECDNPPIDDNEQSYLVTPGNELIGMLANMYNKSQEALRRDAVHNIMFDVDASIKLKAYKRCVRSWFLGDESLRANVWSRAHMKVVKLASLLAVCDAYAIDGNGSGIPTVTLAHVDWAVTIVNTTADRLEARLMAGEFGEGDLKAIADAKRYLKRYVTEKAVTLSKPHFNASMHAEQTIGLSHWKAAVSTASFRKAQIGAVRMWQTVVVALCQEGVLVKLKEDYILDRFKFWGDAFGINSNML